MKAQQIRLVVIVVLGVVALFVAKPVMTQIMLYQENQKSKIIGPPPDYVPPINPGGVSMGGGGNQSGSDATGASKSADDSRATPDESNKSADDAKSDGEGGGDLSWLLLLF
jgi:hypothetical protein